MAIMIPTSGEPITATSRDLVNTTWYRFFSDIGKISPFMQTVLDDPDATTVLASLGIATDTFTPTLFNTTNVAASTAFVTNYLQVGSVIHVWGTLAIDPTAGGALTELGMSLPVASNFSLFYQAGGTAISNSNGDHLGILGDTVNDRLILSGVPSSAANNGYMFTVAYSVI